MYSRNDSLKAHIRKVHQIINHNKSPVIAETLYNSGSETPTSNGEINLHLRPRAGFFKRLYVLDDNKAQIDITKLPSPLVLIPRETIVDYVNQYRDIFHPTFPIIHSGSFSVHDNYAEDILIHILCSIGSRYVKDDATSKSVSKQLFVYCMAWLDHKLNFCSETTSSIPIDVFQASLITVYVGLFLGNDDWYKWSISTHFQLVSIAREIGMFQYDPLATEQGAADWHAFLAVEVSRRCSYGLYLIDGQLSTLLNYPPKLSHYEIKHILPCDDRLWEAANEEEWVQTLRDDIIDEAFPEAEDKTSFFNLSASPFTARLNLYHLQQQQQQRQQQRLYHGKGVYFLEALQQTLIYGVAPDHASSFGGMVVLLAIHIMIRNMTQYAGILETYPMLAQDPFSRRSQLGNALNGLRALFPRKSSSPKKNHTNLRGMGGLFEATWNLAYVHLHLPDTVITSGIVEVTLDATIATAAALARPHSIIPPGTALLGNDFHHVPYETLSLVNSHIIYFLKSFKAGTKETNPLLTFMFYKVSLVTWQVLKALLEKAVSKDEKGVPSPLTQNAIHQEYMMKRLAMDILSNVEECEDHDDIEHFEERIESLLSSFDTWAIGKCAAVSFNEMLRTGEGYD